MHCCTHLQGFEWNVCLHHVLRTSGLNWEERAKKGGVISLNPMFNSNTKLLSCYSGSMGSFTNIPSSTLKHKRNKMKDRVLLGGFMPPIYCNPLHYGLCNSLILKQSARKLNTQEGTWSYSSKLYSFTFSPLLSLAITFKKKKDWKEEETRKLQTRTKKKKKKKKASEKDPRSHAKQRRKL